MEMYAGDLYLLAVALQLQLVLGVCASSIYATRKNTATVKTIANQTF